MTKPQDKTAPIKKAVAPAAEPKAYIIVFGIEAKAGATQAARFDVSQATVVKKAARAIKFGYLEVSSPELLDIAKQLPVGKLYSTGSAVMTTVRAELYARLLGAIGNKRAAQAMELGLPSAWKDIAVGHLVLAQETAADGWWEGIVTERRGDNITVAWRDFPREPPVSRHVAAVALLNAETA